MDQVVITGIGVLASIGLDLASFTTALDQGDIGTSRAPWWDDDLGHNSWVSPIRGFDAKMWMDDRVIDGSARFTQLAVAAAVQAVADHGAELDAMVTGVVMGNTMGGARELLEAQHALDTEGPAAVPKKLNIQAWPNMAGGQIAMRWALHGPILTVCTACASSLDALGLAARTIEYGDADVMLAGGAESGLAEALFYSQRSYGMSGGSISDPTRAMIPFDVDRQGIVEGEGAAVLVLERRTRAEARGARIYGSVRGYGCVSDAHHPSSPEPQGIWEELAMRKALTDSHRDFSDVDAVVAHGTGTPVGDAAEIRALNRLIAGRDRPLHVTSIKGNTGHTGASAGAMAVIAALHGFEHQRLVHTAGTTNLDHEIKFEVPLGRPAQLKLDVVQVNSFGFGGQDSSLVVTRD